MYLIVRGIKHDTDRFISDLQAQYFPWPIVREIVREVETVEGQKVKIKDKFQQIGALQLSVREWGGMVELAFPENQLQEVIDMLKPFTRYPSFKWAEFLARIGLDLEQLPDIDKLTDHMPDYLPKRITWKAYHPHIRVVCLGTRKDNWGVFLDDAGRPFYGEGI